MKKRSIRTRINVAPATSKISNRRSSLTTSSLISFDESTITNNTRATIADTNTRMNNESITFVCFDLPFQSIPTLNGSLRAINDYIQIFPDSSICLDWMRCSNDRIFFISSSSDRELITTVHACPKVDAIFILNSDEKISKGDFPKLTGIFNQHEELFMVLEDTLTWFEQVHLELFAFEQGKIFLWCQLWKQESMSTKVTSGKGELVDMARDYYRGNMKTLKLVDTFYQSYRPCDALRWCYRSPFPCRLLNHALRSLNCQQLSLFSFLLTDASRIIKQQPKRNTSAQIYRGMKLTGELVDRLEKHAGGLICTSGFFTGTKSRTAALALASSPTQRPDLLSVLFKIDCDPSASFAELSANGTFAQIVFDVYTTFRVMCVNRGQMSVVKLKTAGEEGRRVAREYKETQKGENMLVVLDELLAPPKAPPPQELSSLPSPPASKPTSTEVSKSTISDDEIQAQEHIERSEYDLALAAYRRIQPISPRILKLIGQLYFEKQDDNDHAMEYYTQALQMQEKAGEDVSDTLSHLGIIHSHRGELDLALDYHKRALALREIAHSPNPTDIANSLRGIANVLWARRELPEALGAVQRALALNQTCVPINEENVAVNLATIANIHHDSGDDMRALEYGTQALSILERTVPANSPKLAALLHNLGAIRLGLKEIAEARNSFDRALEIYTNILPPKHPKIIAVENHVQHIDQMQKNSKGTSELQP